MSVDKSLRVLRIGFGGADFKPDVSRAEERFLSRLAYVFGLVGEQALERRPTSGTINIVDESGLQLRDRMAEELLREASEDRLVVLRLSLPRLADYAIQNSAFEGIAEAFARKYCPHLVSVPGLIVDHLPATFRGSIKDGLVVVTDEADCLMPAGHSSQFDRDEHLAHVLKIYSPRLPELRARLRRTRVWDETNGDHVRYRYDFSGSVELLASEVTDHLRAKLQSNLAVFYLESQPPWMRKVMDLVYENLRDISLDRPYELERDNQALKLPSNADSSVEARPAAVVLPFLETGRQLQECDKTLRAAHFRPVSYYVVLSATGDDEYNGLQDILGSRSSITFEYMMKVRRSSVSTRRAATVIKGLTKPSGYPFVLEPDAFWGLVKENGVTTPVLSRPRVISQLTSCGGASS